MLTKETFIEQTNNRYLFKEEYLIKNHPQFHSELTNFIEGNHLENITFNQKLWHYIHNEVNIPKCECGSDVNFRTFKKGYREFCSNECVNKSSSVQERIKKTFIQNYGVDNPMKNEAVKQKTKDTCILKYGVDNSLKSPEVRERIGETLKSKYGVDNVFKLQDVQNKIKQTLIQKYGFDAATKNPDIIRKTFETNLKRYGVTSYNKTEESKTRNKELKDVRLSKSLGDEYIFQNRGGSDVNITHVKCGSTFTISRELLSLRKSRGHEICTVCNTTKKSNTSQYETELSNFLSGLGVEVVLNNKKILGNNQELDIFLPKYGVGIEINGLYWHSDQYKPKDYHTNKTKIGESKGLQIIHIFEDEWLYKKEIVLSLLTNRLNLNVQRLYARKCFIKELDPKTTKEFLDKNHIQGSVNSKFKFGLYFENELVSVMTFGNLRKSLGSTTKVGHFEMLRFCNKLGYNVIGAASKLLSYFVKNYKPVEIVSYSDNRYFTGGLYGKLGFDFIKETEPSYFYLFEKQRYHRFKYRKDVLVKMGFDKDKTENQIMSERGFLKIWDCGNKKWVLRF